MKNRIEEIRKARNIRQEEFAKEILRYFGLDKYFDFRYPFSLTSIFGKYIMKLNFGTRYYFIY